MTPRDLLNQAQADGVQIVLTESGRVQLLGADEARQRWLLTCWQYHRELVTELSAGRLTGVAGHGTGR